MSDLHVVRQTPRVVGQPRILLGEWPTPVHRLNFVSSELGVQVWAKREDRCGAWGGNKVRKLEMWLARRKVLSASRIVVAGAGTSTWAAAAALHATQCGLDVVVALAGPIPEDRQRLFEALDVKVIHRRSLNALPLAIAKARFLAGRAAVALPMGGSGWPGDLGSYLCGIEIVDRPLLGFPPRPRAVFVAAGTSGTAGGIAAAFARRGEPIPVIAVRVTPRPFGTKQVVRWRARGVLRKLPDVAMKPAVVGESGFFGEGYGQPGPGVDEAIALAAQDGLQLERTYTAKAFAALISYARAGAEGPLLFVHTATGPNMPSLTSLNRARG